MGSRDHLDRERGNRKVNDNFPALPPPPGPPQEPSLIPGAPASWQQPPALLNQVTIPQVPQYSRPRRSVGVAVALTLLFGPFGLYYTETPLIATLAVCVVIVLALLTGGLSGFVTFPATVICAAVRASKSV